MSPEISVIIPCRNEKDFIQDTIKSLLNQNGLSGNIEIIVVDGCSTDGTKEILDQISLTDERVKVINNQKKVTPVALNLGITNSSAKYICIMGAHAEYSDDYLFNCLQLFKKHPEVSCVGGPITSRGKNNFAKAAAIAMSSSIGVGNAKHRFPQYEGYAEMACFPMFKRDVFDKYGFYDESLIRNQDDEFCFRISKAGEKIFISPKVKSIYYVRDSAVKLFRQYFQYGFWRVAVLQKHKTPISFRQQVPILFFSSIFLLVIAGFFFSNIYVAIILPLIYFLILIIFSIKIIINSGILIGANFILSVFILHLSYAAGFAWGVLNFILKKNTIDRN
jgi:glycosyltransferase involved in cell wall biosynthesis